MSGATSNETLVWNEQMKLIANALDRASTALGVSSLIPLWQLHRADTTRWAFALYAYVFVFAAYLLRLLARRALKALI